MPFRNSSKVTRETDKTGFATYMMSTLSYKIT